MHGQQAQRNPRSDYGPRYKLIARNLPYDTSLDDIQKHLQTIIPCSVAPIRNQRGEVRRGSCFIFTQSAESMEKLLHHNRIQISGRTVYIEPDRHTNWGDRERDRDIEKESQQPFEPLISTLLIRNPRNGDHLLSEAEILSALRTFGDVRDLYTGKRTNGPNEYYFAVVQMASEVTAKQIVELSRRRMLRPPISQCQIVYYPDGGLGDPVLREQAQQPFIIEQNPVMRRRWVYVRNSPRLADARQTVEALAKSFSKFDDITPNDIILAKNRMTRTPQHYIDAFIQLHSELAAQKLLASTTEAYECGISSCEKSNSLPGVYLNQQRLTVEVIMSINETKSHIICPQFSPTVAGSARPLYSSPGISDSTYLRGD